MLSYLTKEKVRQFKFIFCHSFFIASETKILFSLSTHIQSLLSVAIFKGS
ncbi:hypothetical protein HMPREF1551_01543 [Capnocytophaga sp. oral taxon 863 str. F0517]|nr:hypothetical protein HMPREF1551_01543 [Capnocytophaga sp. oral taxon 863 str. F0517]